MASETQTKSRAPIKGFLFTFSLFIWGGFSSPLSWVLTTVSLPDACDDGDTQYLAAASRKMSHVLSDRARSSLENNTLANCNQTSRERTAARRVLGIISVQKQTPSLIAHQVPNGKHRTRSFLHGNKTLAPALRDLLANQIEMMVLSGKICKTRGRWETEPWKNHQMYKEFRLGTNQLISNNFQFSIFCFLCLQRLVRLKNSTKSVHI